MTIQLFSAIWVLVYASAVMALLLNVRPLELTGAKRLVFWVALPCIIFVNLIAMKLIDLKTFGAFYPFIGQLPVFLVFYTISNGGFIKSFFVLLTTMFLTFPYTVVTILVIRTFNPPAWMVIVIMVLISILLLLAIRRFMAANFAYMMGNIEAKETLKFCFIPLFYNILTYAIGKYTGGIVVLPLRCFLFLNTLVVYFLLMNAIKNASHMQLLRHEKDVLFMQMQAAKQQFEQLKTMQDHTVAYRHDLRHHLSLLGSFAESGEMGKIKEYLAAAHGELDAITPIHYCLNQTVNLILSSFYNKAKAHGVTLSVDAKLPKELSIPDTELCAVLSNGLENALTASAQVEDATLRTIWVTCSLNRNKLLIMIKNPYKGGICMKNEIPTSQQEGHGFGCRSMVAIAEKRKGHCIFNAENGMFILRVVLPL